VSFLAVLTALACIRPEELHKVTRDRDARIVDGTKRALRFAIHDPQLRLVLAVVTIVSTVGFNFHVLVPLLASDTMHVGPEGFGLLSAAFGGGALIGALVTASFREASWRLFATGAASFGVLAIVLAPIRSAALAGVVLFAIGIAFTLFTANANALVQLGAPDYLRGRLIGLYLFAFVGLAPVGGLLAGWLAELGGTSLAFVVAGATSLAAIGLAAAARRQTADAVTV
jgi:predicted MFS family arabinose efflux permease